MLQNKRDRCATSQRTRLLQGIEAFKSHKEYVTLTPIYWLIHGSFIQSPPLMQLDITLI